MPTMDDPFAKIIQVETANTTEAQRTVKALRVLIVEDEAMIAMLLAEVLRELGHEVCATEATEAGAIAAAVRYKPDLMIVDNELRKGSGISAVEQIIRSGFIPHLFVTGKSTEGPVAQSKCCGDSEAVHHTRTGMGDQTRARRNGYPASQSAGFMMTRND